MELKSFSQFLSEQGASPDVFLDEDTGEQYFIELNEELLLERRIKIRINSRGVKTKRIICGPGRVLKTTGDGRKICVVQTGAAKARKKIAIRRAIRTKKAKGSGYARRVNIKRQRAIKRRKSMGIRPGL